MKSKVNYQDKIRGAVTVTEDGDVIIKEPNTKDFPHVYLDIDADGNKTLKIPFELAAEIVHEFVCNMEEL